MSEQFGPEAGWSDRSLIVPEQRRTGSAVDFLPLSPDHFVALHECLTSREQARSIDRPAVDKETPAAQEADRRLRAELLRQDIVDVHEMYQTLWQTEHEADGPEIREIRADAVRPLLEAADFLRAELGVDPSAYPGNLLPRRAPAELGTPDSAAVTRTIAALEEKVTKLGAEGSEMEVGSTTELLVGAAAVFLELRELCMRLRGQDERQYSLQRAQELAQRRVSRYARLFQREGGNARVLDLFLRLTELE